MVKKNKKTVPAQPPAAIPATPPVPAKPAAVVGGKQLAHRVAFSGFFLLMALLVGMLAWPHLTAIIFAGILAGTFHPLLRYLVERRGWLRTRAANIICLLIIVVVFLPASYILVRLTHEIAAVYRLAQAPETTQMLRELLFGEGRLALAAERIFNFFLPDQPYNALSVQAMFLDAAKRLSGLSLALLNAMVGNLFEFFFQFVVMLLLVYGLLVYGPDLRHFLSELSPLPATDMEIILDRFNEMNYVTLVCNFLGGIIQGGLAGLCFALAGIPSSLLWTVVMVVLAFIPLIGISVVYIPAALYLLAIGQAGAAAGVFVWCTAVALVTENWFKPIFMGERVRLNSLLILLSILGGMSAFGMAGIFYGPLIVLLFLTAADFFRRAYSIAPAGTYIDR